MGFLKDLGDFAGGFVGEVVGGAVKMVGDAIDNDFIREVGDGVNQATRATGALLGDVAEGAVTVVGGMIDQDEAQTDSGMNQLGGALSRTATGVGQSLTGIANNSGKVIDGFLSGDHERGMEGLRAVGKTVAIGALAVGVVDIVGGVGGVDTDLGGVDPAVGGAFAATDVFDPVTFDGLHDVDPHHVSGYTTADGLLVEDYWRDGDGDTSTNLSKADGGGYLRGDPDGDPSNNLG